MADLYATYAELAAAETRGVDYDFRSAWPAGTSWASIAIHGGGIEPGTSEIAEAVAGPDMRFYEFDGLKASGNGDLHITSSNFDEPTAVHLVGTSHRTLSFHGYTGTTGVAETLIGGLDVSLRNRIQTALEAAGFTITVASSEFPGTDPTNICNRNLLGAGVQFEMSRALRESFFTDFTRAGRKDPANRTSAFTAYVAAVQSVAGQRGGIVSLGSANVSRWVLRSAPSADVDQVATVETDKLAAGGGQFVALAARLADANNCYLARVEMSTSQQVILTLRKRVGGTETFLAQHTTGITHAVGRQVRWRLQVAWNVLRARAWMASDPEPSTWQLTIVDGDLTAAGQIGMRHILSSAYSGSLPVIVGVRDFAATALPSLLLSSTAENGPWTDDVADSPLDVRVGGEQVTASAISSSFLDTLTRSETAGWGPPWSVAMSNAAGFSADGARGAIALTGNGRHGIVFDVGSPDQDVILSIRSPVTATGASIIHGWMARYVDTENHYYVEAQFRTDGQIWLSLNVRSGSVNTTYLGPTAVQAYTAGTTYRLGVQLIGQTYRARVWPGGLPPAWQLSRPATATPNGTRAGARALLAVGNTNTQPVAVTYDNVEVLNPQLVTLSARGVNGVQRAWPAGTPVGVWEPAVAAL